MPRHEINNAFSICPKNVSFSYNNEAHAKTDGVTVGSPLHPVLAGIFMVDLKSTVLPTFKEYVTPWRRYDVEDTIS